MPPAGDSTAGGSSPASEVRRLRLLSANIQAGSSTRRYSDYATRSWSHVLPGGNKRGMLDEIAQLAGRHDIVGLQESDPGSLRSGFTNQTHYLAERGGFDYWSHQPNRAWAASPPAPTACSARLEPVEVDDHSLPGRVRGRGILLARFGDGTEGLSWPWPTCRWARSRAARSWPSSPSCCRSTPTRC
jgi:endonuclease/exonuclease/phosphatase family metal-dependent hydrolase